MLLRSMHKYIIEHDTSIKTIFKMAALPVIPEVSRNFNISYVKPKFLFHFLIAH